jgi:hypothetical protein
MAHRDKDAMIGMGARWWKFPGAQMETNLWEMEWCSDGKVYLHDDTGAVIEGIELSDAQIEQMRREELLADVLELAAGKLRSGEGWDEGTTADVLSEVFDTYPRRMMKALALSALFTGTKSQQR